MTKKFKKLAIASGVAMGMAGIGATAHAAMTGYAGEALLFPLAVWGDSGQFDAVYPVDSNTGIRSLTADTDLATADVDTVMTILVPSTVGHDTLPNDFTASHTTPTNDPTTMFPVDPDLGIRIVNNQIIAGNQIKLFWFDQRSNKRWDTSIWVTPDDLVEVSWRQLAAGLYRNQPGYMIATTQKATTGAAADFDMFGSSYLVMEENVNSNDEVWFPLPVYAMNDGADGAQDSAVSVEDQVKYDRGVPRAASPLITGMRTNRSDGDDSDFTVFDLLTSDRNDAATIHVVWLDENLDPTNNPAGNPVPVNVFDSSEEECSSTVPLPHELNVVFIPDSDDRLSGNIRRPAWTSGFGYQTGVFPNPPITQPYAALCVEDIDLNEGFVSYRGIDEYVDTNDDRPESAGAAFSIVFGNLDYDTAPANGAVDEVTGTVVPAFERGTYKD